MDIIGLWKFNDEFTRKFFLYLIIYETVVWYGVE